MFLGGAALSQSSFRLEARCASVNELRCACLESLTSTLSKVVQLHNKNSEAESRLYLSLHSALELKQAGGRQLPAVQDRQRGLDVRFLQTSWDGACSTSNTETDDALISNQASDGFARYSSSSWVEQLVCERDTQNMKKCS